ncbi:MAG: Na+/H+ antiporter NhaA [Candidatus Kapabacteria bacterium]|nr:Na+/H+ antiporter NhaA [Candidatus Kapabacteria bacterium]
MPQKKKPIRIVKAFQDFFRSTVAGSTILIFSAFIAMIWINSNYGHSYHTLWDTILKFNILGFQSSFTLHQFVNDGLMVVFFFLVGLEIKREIIIGELSDFRKAMLPLIGALGGVLIPALIYEVFNFGSLTAKGWAIPMATDIAFALGILALLGKKVPIGLKVFLAALAIADDLAAIIIIALFYTASINVVALFVVVIIIAFMIMFNFMNLQKPFIYILFGVLLWLAMLQSGVHSTIAGVITAFLVPVSTKKKKKEFGENQANTAIYKIEHKLTLIVAFFVMPIFALVNSGVELNNFNFSIFANKIALGIFLGLFIGKPFGVFLFVWLFVKYKMAKLPYGVGLSEMFGVSILCGIGFTMSIFVSNLSFQIRSEELNLAKTSIIFASTLSAIIGFIYLSKVLKPNK